MTFWSKLIARWRKSEQLSAPPRVVATSEMQLGDDVKAWYPEQWQQDAVLQAWNTGKPVVARRPGK